MLVCSFSHAVRKKVSTTTTSTALSGAGYSISTISSAQPNRNKGRRDASFAPAGYLLRLCTSCLFVSNPTRFVQRVCICLGLGLQVESEGTWRHRSCRLAAAFCTLCAAFAALFADETTAQHCHAGAKTAATSTALLLLLRRGCLLVDNLRRSCQLLRFAILRFAKYGMCLLHRCGLKALGSHILIASFNQELGMSAFLVQDRGLGHSALMRLPALRLDASMTPPSLQLFFVVFSWFCSSFFL